MKRVRCAARNTQLPPTSGPGPTPLYDWGVCLVRLRPAPRVARARAPRVMEPPSGWRRTSARSRRLYGGADAVPGSALVDLAICLLSYTRPISTGQDRASDGIPLARQEHSMTMLRTQVRRY